MASSRFRFVLPAAALWAALGIFAPAARADDGPDGPMGSEEPSIAEQMQAQIRKIIALMRENEAALLEASRGSGKKPAGADVKPPEPPAEPPSAAPEKGGEAKRSLDELVKASQRASAPIPKEIEELLRMAPC